MFVVAGANAISGVNFAVEDPRALGNEAREKAIQDARDRAQAMAAILGVELGKPVLMTELSGGVPVARLYGDGVGGGGVEDVAPAITPGTFSVSVSVQVVYEIR